MFNRVIISKKEMIRKNQRLYAQQSVSVIGFEWIVVWPILSNVLLYMTELKIKSKRQRLLLCDLEVCICVLEFQFFATINIKFCSLS